MTTSDPRAEVAAQGLAVQLTDQIDKTKAEAYLDKVREHFPKGFEDQIWYGNVHDIVNNHVFHCFWTDVDPKECADKIIEKVGA